MQLSKHQYIVTVRLLANNNLAILWKGYGNILIPVALMCHSLMLQTCIHVWTTNTARLCITSKQCLRVGSKHLSSFDAALVVVCLRERMFPERKGGKHGIRAGICYLSDGASWQG